MTRRKPEHIVRLLHKADEELAKGKAVEDICRDEQISPATYYRWQRKYGGLQVEDAKRLKALEIECELNACWQNRCWRMMPYRNFWQKKHDSG
jgi:transposase